MKARIYGVLALLLLFSTGLFYSCSDDDEARTFPAYPLNVQAQQDSADPGGVVLTWEEVEDVFNYVIYRSTSPDGEFKKIGHTSTTSYTNGSEYLEFSTTYYYKVVSESSMLEEGTMPDEAVEVTTGGPATGYYTPVIDAVASTSGGGSTAVLDFIRVEWRVEEEDAEGYEKFEVYRDENLIYTYEPTSYSDNKFEYEDDDASLVFEQEYTYKVIAYLESGEQYESEEISVTPNRPDEITRETPEIVDVKTDPEEDIISIYFTDVSSSGNDKVEFYAEIRDTDYYWEFETYVKNLGSDDDGNLILSLDASEAPEKSGFKYLESKVRVYTRDDWTEWSITDVSAVSY